MICHHLQIDLLEAKNAHVNKLLLCFILLLPSQGTPFQIHGTKVHSLEITLCACLACQLLHCWRKWCCCMAPEDHQVKKKNKQQTQTFKEQGHVRRAEDSHITMQTGFVFTFCAFPCPLTAWRVLAAPSSRVHLLVLSLAPSMAPPRPPWCPKRAGLGLQDALARRCSQCWHCCFYLW